MDYPDYIFFDTLSAARRELPHLPNHQLHTVAQECGYCLDNHHHALADAEACAHIALQILEGKDVIVVGRKVELSNKFSY